MNAKQDNSADSRDKHENQHSHEATAEQLRQQDQQKAKQKSKKTKSNEETAIQQDGVDLFASSDEDNFKEEEDREVILNKGKTREGSTGRKKPYHVNSTEQLTVNKNSHNTTLTQSPTNSMVQSITGSSKKPKQTVANRLTALPTPIHSCRRPKQTTTKQTTTKRHNKRKTSMRKKTRKIIKIQENKGNNQQQHCA